MPACDFNNGYLRNLMNKLYRENKEIILMGDYNINLLNYESDS